MRVTVQAILACENSRLCSLFAAGHAARNVPSGEERAETDVFVGYRDIDSFVKNLKQSDRIFLCKVLHVAVRSVRTRTANLKIVPRTCFSGLYGVCSHYSYYFRVVKRTVSTPPR